MGKAGDVQSWVVLILFCFFSSSNAIQWITFASIATPAREFFSLNTNELNHLSSIYMIIYAVGVILTCSVFERWGVRRGVLIGSGLNALGSLLKFAPGLFYPSFTTMMIPQVINSVAQLFVLSTPPVIAAHYFPPHRRVLATAIASTSNSLGNAIALLVPPLVVKTADRRSFMILFGGQMAYCCLVFVGIIFFFHSPRYLHRRSSVLHDVTSLTASTSSAAGRAERTNQVPPPLSSSAGENSRFGCLRNETFRNIVHVVRVSICLLKSSDYLFLFIAFSISTGSIWTFASVLTQILEPFGVGQETAGMVGAINIVVGTIAAYVIGAWVGRSRYYKLTLIFCFLLSVLCCSGLLFVMIWSKPKTFLLNFMSGFLYVLAGIGQNTAIPICFEFSMEITHPLPDSIPGALFMAGANIMSLILLSVSSAVLGDGMASKWGAVNVVLIIVVVSIVGMIFALFPVEKMRRYDAEQEALREGRESSTDVNGTEERNVIGNHITQKPQPADPNSLIDEKKENGKITKSEMPVCDKPGTISDCRENGVNSSSSH